MRKFWLKVFLLCMACMICMGGLCMAGNENWVQYLKNAKGSHYVDTNSITTREYEGRKYLDLKVKWGEPAIIWHTLVDVEKRKFFVLEIRTNYKGPKWSSQDISKITQNSSSVLKYEFIETLLIWVEQNYPAVINEIREHNKTAPPLPAGTMDVSGPRRSTAIDPAPGIDRQPGFEGPEGEITDVTGAAGAPSGTVSTAGIEYEVLDSGAVKFTRRRGATKEKLELYTNQEDYWKENTNYIFTKPEEFKAWPGTYALGAIVSDFFPAEPDNDTMHISSFFDYDPATNTLQFYATRPDLVGVEYDADPENAFWGNRMHVIDKNTVYIEESDTLGPLVKEGPFRIGVGKDFDKKYEVKYTMKYSSCGVPEYRDVNGCAWSYILTGRHNYVPDYWAAELNEVEAAIICCMLKGQLGEVPEGHDLEYGTKYHFSR